MKTIINTLRADLHGLPRSQQRVLAELERLSQSVKPGCMGIMFGQLQDAPTLRKALARSGIAVLLAEGPDQACRIYDHVPAVWGELFLGPRPRTVEQTTRLVALNLDWYLKPPAPLFRAEWIWLSLAGLIMLAGTLCFLLSLMGPLGYGGWSYFLPPLVATLVWIALQGDYSRAVWIRQLHEHLRETYAAQPAEPTPPEKPTRPD
jgi:hypothetical protein